MTPDNQLVSLGRILENSGQFLSTIPENTPFEQISQLFINYLVESGYPVERLERNSVAPHDIVDTISKTCLLFDSEDRWNGKMSGPLPDPDDPVDLQFDYGQSWGE